MYELLSFTIGALISGVFCFCYNRKQAHILQPKERPFIADTHISIAQRGDMIVMIGTEELYAHKSSLASLQAMCHRLKEKDIEIILVPERFIKQTWIIPRDTFLSKQSNHRSDSGNNK